MNNSSPSITIAISTIACNFESFISIFNFSSLSDADEVIIVIQGESDNLLLDKLEQKYIVIIDKGLGVSRSRNLALERSQSDFIWFMDDDVIIKENAILKVKKYMEEGTADIYTVRTMCATTNNPYKNYSNKMRLKRRDIVSISTIEIIASRQYIINSQVKFNASMGLGTKFPSCEENVFLLDLFDLGAEIQHIPEYVQIHPHINRTLAFTNPATLFAKGVFCKRYNGIMGAFLLLFWMIKASWNGARFRDSIQLVSGYLSGNKILIY